ncbi:MAG: NAD(FAD)-dependent dehydrogenase [Myxococcaceae bacterium]|nr:NAD(FAD)-dependent dehydrogenase [Myxococcaceae bacterium]
MKRVVIVGASLAGARAASQLRRLGYCGELWLIGDEPHLPYDRPPLSKEILRGDWPVGRLPLLKQTPAELDLTLRLDTRVEQLELARRELITSRERIGFDGLVIASGARARKLPGGALSGVHVLRTLDDALRLRAELAHASSFAIVGAGFIGAEVASSMRRPGLNVTLIDSLPVPLAHTLGVPMGQLLAGLHEKHGVQLRAGVAVAGLEGNGAVARVRLRDGSAIEATVVLVGVGCVPNTEWLAGSGLALDDGVLCDQTCTVLDGHGQAVPGIVAAGDVARYDSALFGERIRVEHWTHAAEQADRAASTLLGDTSPWINAPLFWSDQYGLRIQFAGRASGHDRMQLVDGSLEEQRFVALYARGERLVGALALRRPAQLMRYRKLIEARASLEEALSLAK